MKGFTLVEIIAVIVLLGVISLIAIPIVTNSVSESKEKLYDAQMKEIEEKAEKWAYKNMELLPTVEGEVVTLTLLQLKQEGLLGLNVKDPRNNQLIPNDLIITITYKNNDYDFYVVRDSGTSTTYEVDSLAPIIIMNGEIVQYVEINTSYEELNAVAKDTNGNLVDVTIQYLQNGNEISEIDTTKLSTYNVIYTATVNNHASKINRTVIIRDTIAPILTVPTSISVTDVSTFDIMEGVSVSDNSLENIEVIVTGYDTSVGTKTVSYTATDSSGNSVTKKRTVIIEG